MGAALLFLRGNWELVAIGLLMAAVLYYHADAKDARHDLAMAIASAEVAVSKHKAEDLQKTLDDKDFKTKQDGEHATQVAAYRNTVTGLVDELRKKGNIAGLQKPEPVRNVTVCGDNADANERLRAAVSRAESAIGDVTKRTIAGIVAYQVGIGTDIIGPAGQQQIELKQIIDWAKRSAEVNALH